MTDQIHDSFPEPSDVEDHSDHASVEDAAAGHAAARENNLPSNKYIGNNMISNMANRSTYGDIQRTQRYSK